MIDLLDTMLALRDSAGREVSLLFTELPDRGIYPDYYEQITDPIDLSIMRARVNLGQYATLAELGLDVELMAA